MTKYIILFLLMISSLEAASIKGVVFDNDTKKVLAGATVRIKDSRLGAYSDQKGFFQIDGLKEKKDYTIIVSYVGYDLLEKKCNTTNDTLKIYLKEQILNTKHLVVTASKRVQTIQEVPMSISVLNNLDITEKNINNIDDALQYLPGVNVKEGNLDIRGSTGFTLGVGSRVSMLIDGIPILSADNGDIKFDALPITNMEAVEVVKGAGSALYGSSAIGGVVNVLTKKIRNKTPEIYSKSFVGYFTKPKYEEWDYSDKFQGQYGQTLGYQQALSDKFAIAVTANMLWDKSYRLYDKSERWGLFTKLQYTHSDFTSLDIISKIGSEKKDDWLYWDGLSRATFPSESSDQDRRFQSDKYFVGANFQHIIDDNSFLAFRNGFFHTKIETLIDKDLNDYRQSDANSINSELQYSSILFEGFNLTSGLAYNLNNVESISYGNRNQNIVSFYSQAEYKDPFGIIFNFGFRYDYEKSEGSKENNELSPKLGISKNFKIGDSDLNIRASTGRGFRAAMAVEKYSTISYGAISIVPNPELQPETSWSVDLGIDFQTEIAGLPLYFEAALFHNEMDNLIEAKVSGKDIKFQNITEARIRGIELIARTHLGFLGLETSFMFMDPEDLTLNQTLKYRSTFQNKNSIVIPLGMFEFQADYRYLSKVDEVDDLELKLMGVKDVDKRVDVHIIDARIIAKLDELVNQNLKLSLNAKNLLDYYYVDTVSNLAPTRFVSLQIEYLFQ